MCFDEKCMEQDTLRRETRNFPASCRACMSVIRSTYDLVELCAGEGDAHIREMQAGIMAREVGLCLIVSDVMVGQSQNPGFTKLTSACG